MHPKLLLCTLSCGYPVNQSTSSSSSSLLSLILTVDSASSLWPTTHFSFISDSEFIALDQRNGSHALENAYNTFACSLSRMKPSDVTWEWNQRLASSVHFQQCRRNHTGSPTTAIYFFSLLLPNTAIYNPWLKPSLFHFSHYNKWYHYSHPVTLDFPFSLAPHVQTITKVKRLFQHEPKALSSPPSVTSLTRSMIAHLDH